MASKCNNIQRWFLATNEFELEFYELVDKWKKNTSYLSSMYKMVMDPNYKKIKRMGTDVIPLILKELQREPDHWMNALTWLTGEDPCFYDLPENIDIEKMSKEWIEWGKKKGYI